jgi:hypothetical protein
MVLAAKFLVVVEMVIIALPARPSGKTEMSDEQVPAMVKEAPETLPKLNKPAPLIVAVIDSAFDCPVELYVLTLT